MTATKTGSQPAEKQKRGFALLDPVRRTRMAAAGGKAAHAKGTAHHWTSETASQAAKKRHAKANARSLGT